MGMKKDDQDDFLDDQLDGEIPDDENDSKNLGVDSHDDSDDDRSDDDDERIVGKGDQTEEDEEREKIRERRREQRKHKKEMQKAREQVLRSELTARDQMIEEMAQRLAALEQRGQGNEAQQIDATLQQLASAYVDARNHLAKGTETQNGALVAEATERMQQIRIEAQRLEHQKQMLQHNVRQAQQTPKVDPRLKNYAADWMRTNSWYKADGQDRETATVRAIDAGLAAEGMNPNTQEYWDELSERVKVALPHRFKAEYTGDNRRTEKQQSSPVGGSSRATASGKSSQGYTLSPERVEAMKEAGVWDDPKKRAAMIEAYKRYDKEHKAA